MYRTNSLRLIMIDNSSSGSARRSALKALARDSARIRSSSFSLDERKCWIRIEGWCSLNFLINANASSAVVLEYQTSPFSFFAPSKSRACRSAAGSFMSAASVASRFCAGNVPGRPAAKNGTIQSNKSEFLIRAPIPASSPACGREKAESFSGCDST